MFFFFCQMMELKNKILFSELICSIALKWFQRPTNFLVLKILVFYNRNA